MGVLASWTRGEGGAHDNDPSHMVVEAATTHARGRLCDPFGLRPLTRAICLMGSRMLERPWARSVLVQPDGWARGEREGYGGPRDVTSLSLSLDSGSVLPGGGFNKRLSLFGP